MLNNEIFNSDAVQDEVSLEERVENVTRLANYFHSHSVSFGNISSVEISGRQTKWRRIQKLELTKLHLIYFCSLYFARCVNLSPKTSVPVTKQVAALSL